MFGYRQIQQGFQLTVDPLSVSLLQSTAFKAQNGFQDHSQQTYSKAAWGLTSHVLLTRAVLKEIVKRRTQKKNQCSNGGKQKKNVTLQVYIFISLLRIPGCSGDNVWFVIMC